MNNTGRKELDVAIVMVNDAHAICSILNDEEQQKYDNMPKGLQESEKAQVFKKNVSDLEEIASELEKLVCRIEEVKQR